MLQLLSISLANCKLVLISHMIMLASICDVPITSILLSSDRANIETSGLIAVNLYSSGLRKVYLIKHSASGSSFSCIKIIIEPALYNILSLQSILTLFRPIKSSSSYNHFQIKFASRILKFILINILVDFSYI